MTTGRMLVGLGWSSTLAAHNARAARGRAAWAASSRTAAANRPLPAPPAPPAAANNTWWNIYSSEGTQLNLPDCSYGPLLNFVGGPYGPPDCGQGTCDLPAKPTLFPGFCENRVQWWVEQRQRGKRLQPPDLFAAMVDTRRDRLGRR